MNRDGIPLGMMLRAIHTYLSHAYPGGSVPAHVQARIVTIQTAPDFPAALTSDVFEKTPSEVVAGQVDKYRLRLGNARYPHMKLGMERCSGTDDFVFVVDTHDRHFRVDYTLPGAEELARIQEFDSQLKTEIEEHWRREGIPTFADRLREFHETHAPRAPARKTVLVIDDDPALIDLERCILEDAGYQVVTASAGNEALETVANGRKIDLCLLDIMMPRVDGVKVIRELKQRGHKAFPVIFVSALPRDRQEVKFADAYVEKPFDPGYLIQRIQEFLGS